MGIFGSFKSAVGKIFGKKTAPSFAPKNQRTEEQADVSYRGRAGRRIKLLKKRMAEGKSERVYKDKKTNAQIALVFNGQTYNGQPELEEFLNGQPYNRFASSNVNTVMYDRVTERLYVQYIKKKRWYEYRRVPLEEARYMFNAVSKGIHVWDNLRIRGTKTGNKKPTSQVAGPPSHLPYLSTSGIGSAHAERKRAGLD